MDPLGVINTLIALVTLAVTVVIFRLGSRLSFRSTMLRRGEIAAEVMELHLQILRDGINSQVLFMNARRYARGDYERGDHDHRPLLGAMFSQGELAERRHDGVTFIVKAEQSWWDSAQRRTLTETANPAPTVVLLGFIPYDWVDFVNLSGDEAFNKPIFYVRYRGWDRSPYRFYYWAESKPMKFQAGGPDHYTTITDLGRYRPGPLTAVKAAGQGWRIRLSERRAARRFAKDLGREH